MSRKRNLVMFLASEAFGVAHLAARIARQIWGCLEASRLFGPHAVAQTLSPEAYIDSLSFATRAPLADPWRALTDAGCGCSSADSQEREDHARDCEGHCAACMTVDMVADTSDFWNRGPATLDQGRHRIAGAQGMHSLPKEEALSDRSTPDAMSHQIWGRQRQHGPTARTCSASTAVSPHWPAPARRH